MPSRSPSCCRRTFGSSAPSYSRAERTFSERWLLAPAVLYYGYRFISHLSWATLQLGWLKKSVPLDFALTSQPFPVDLSDILNYIFVLSLMIFLVRRFSAARQEEARLSQEMEAARSIQSLLIPAVSQSSPSFAVEHAYLPATEVGGDFFQVLPGTDGSLLIVMGDVSGKGLQAAMTVSAIVGALRDSHERQPPRYSPISIASSSGRSAVLSPAAPYSLLTMGC